MVNPQDKNAGMWLAREMIFSQKESLFLEANSLWTVSPHHPSFRNNAFQVYICLHLMTGKSGFWVLHWEAVRLVGNSAWLSAAMGAGGDRDKWSSFKEAVIWYGAMKNTINPCECLLFADTAGIIFKGGMVYYHSSLATAPSATPLPCCVPSNGMFHQDSATQWNKLRIWEMCNYE